MSPTLRSSMPSVAQWSTRSPVSAESPDAEDLVGTAIPSPSPLGYRNKVEFVVDPGADRFTLGYHRSASTDVVRVESCLLLPKRLRTAPKALAGALRYLSGAEDLGIERIAVRTARHTKDVEVALWTPPGPFPRGAAAKVIGQALPVTSLVRVLYKEQVRRRSVTKVEVLQGRGAWRERLGGLDFTVSAPSFFQTNTEAAERLIELVLDALEPDGSDRVADLYAGAGTFTVPLAERAGAVVAIESSGPAVRDLRRNLETNQLDAEVIGGDAERELATIGHIDLAVVDPPRSGLGQAAIAALAGLGPRTIAYVSCDPATLARDVRALADAGYTLTSATPVDLFPQTYHVETVARLSRD